MVSTVVPNLFALSMSTQGARSPQTKEMHQVKKVLSLDLGLTTGWAVLDARGTIIQTGTIMYSSEEQMRTAITRLLTDYMPVWYVAEMPVVIRGPLGDKLQEVISATRRVLAQSADWVQPSEWKTTPSAKRKCPAGVTIHERDALRMGWWWLSRRQKRAVEN